MPKRTRVGDNYLLAPGEVLPGKERYQVLRYLGQGSFAAAYEARVDSGSTCFVKEYFPPTRCRRYARHSWWKLRSWSSRACRAVR